MAKKARKKVAKKAKKATTKKVVKKWIASARWKGLSREVQIEEVRAAMERGCSNKTAATELGATPGIVAGIRWKEDIPSKNKPTPLQQAQNAEPAVKPAAPAKPQSFVEETNADSLPPVKLAASEATQCEHRSAEKYRCGFEREPGSKFCVRHP